MLIGPAMTGFFNTPSQMPGVVVEPLYITDPFEATVAGSSRGQSAIALGIASAITQFLRPAHSSTSTTG
jgi:N-acetylmuramoyl-L-alanine amidase